MPNFTLSRSDRIPDGTDVELYPEADWPLGHPKGAPQGSPTATVTMTDGTAEFTDVDAGFYYAYALVGSEHIYFSAAVGEDTPGHYTRIEEVDGLQEALDSRVRGGEMAAADTPGSVVGSIEVFDADGASLGFVAVYDEITAA